MKSIKAVFSDFDGTLFTHDRRIEPRDLNTLIAMQTKGIVRILATGRSLFSLAKVLIPDAPFDYVIFSTGAGIIDWAKREIIQQQQLTRDLMQSIYHKLRSLDVDFMMHYPVPENHRFYYHATSGPNKDFLQRLEIYKSYALPLPDSIPDDVTGAAQFVAIMPFNGDIISELQASLPNVNIIRTTSPLDHKTSWIEFFPASVSKGHAAEWLCKRLDIPVEDTFSIGNDYNDLALLQYTKHSYVTPDSPQDMRDMFSQAKVHTGAVLTDAFYDVTLLL